MSPSELVKNSISLTFPRRAAAGARRQAPAVLQPAKWLWLPASVLGAALSLSLSKEQQQQGKDKETSGIVSVLLPVGNNTGI